MTKYELEIKTNLLYQSAKAFEYTGHEDVDHCLDVILDYVKTILCKTACNSDQEKDGNSVEN